MTPQQEATLRSEVAKNLLVLRDMRRHKQYESYCHGGIFNLQIVAAELQEYRHGGRYYTLVHDEALARSF